MPSRSRFAMFILLALTVMASPRPAACQYMFFDLDGDGDSDTYPPDENPATIDVYLVTDKNYDGSPAQCLEGGSPDLRGYTVSLYCRGAGATFTSVANQMPGMTETVPLAAYPYALTVGYGGSQSFPPGKHHLLRITAEFASGCAALEIVRSSCYTPPAVATSFESSCLGVRSDTVLRLGEDWGDTEGFGCSDLLGRWPSVSCPDSVTGVEGQPLTIPVTLTDPDCTIFSFYASPLPQGATFSGLSPFSLGEASGTVSWTPNATQAGTYAITFTATDFGNPFQMPAPRDTCTTVVTITATNEPPIAWANGPYSGVQGVPVVFDGTLSSDPDGDPLQFSWSFGDGASGSGPNPTHAYGGNGTYAVTLTVTDPAGLAAQSSTTATIGRDFTVSVFTTGGSQTTRLPRGRPETCFRIESAPGGSFAPGDVFPGSVTLRYHDPVCGALIASASPVESATFTDSNKNGILEYEACFSSEAMATVAACLPSGTNAVRLRIEGSLADGDRFHGELTHTIVSRGGALATAVSPNPLSPNSALEFTTVSPGFATARLFDIRGRLVATLLDERSIPAGRHRAPLTGFASLRGRLASGIYFLRVTTEHDGSETRALTVLR